MNYSEAYVYEKPLYKPKYYEKIQNNLRTIYGTIAHRNDTKEFEKTRIKNAKMVLREDIIGTELSIAQTKLPNCIIRVVNLDENGKELCEQDYCNGRCNVLIDEQNNITKITSFG